MVKQLLPAIASIILLGSCSSLKTLSLTGNRPVASSAVSPSAGKPAPAKPAETKFIEDIDIWAAPPPATRISPAEKSPESENTDEEKKETGLSTANGKPTVAVVMALRNSVIEKATPLQIKYAILLNTEVELLGNSLLLQGVDEWYGTRYRMGGTSKKGVDCSAFTGAVYSSVYGLAIPRTAREQYRNTRRISITELQEGDLLFFNTTGGVSHVGIYLQNNKFIHATSSKGVMVSDLFERYYLQRYIGAGRIDSKQAGNTVAASAGGGH